MLHLNPVDGPTRSQSRDPCSSALSCVSPATRTVYESDWRIFEGWCSDRGVDALPTSPATVAAFLAAQAERGLRSATIARRCAAVRHYHRLAGVDPLSTNAAIVKTTVKGLRRSLGTAQAKKAPATNVVAALSNCFYDRR
jgi:site-specific recombinase XerD